jgi:hypothetical protein
MGRTITFGVLPAPPTNDEIAQALEDVATLLANQEANPFRVRAYREAARTVRLLDRPVAEVAAEGRKALEALPAIGKSIASAIEEMVHAGRIQMLDRLMGEAGPEDLFMMVPGLGDELARRIHERLGVETLEDLELAAHDGRLATVPGFGGRRVKAVQEVLASLLARSARRRARRIRTADGRAPCPPVSAVLAVDARYRAMAQAGRLRRIAPRRFNPSREAWLPILHSDEAGWHFTALFSNTARAHALGKTDDWVVLFFERDGDEDQCTVVTETHGPMAGRRIVRGREAECAAHYFGAATG